MVWLCKTTIWWKSLYGFIAYIKTDDIYEEIAEDVETRFDTSNYEYDTPLPKVKNKKVIRLMKDELGGKIMTKFVGLGAKTYGYLIDDSSGYKKAKGTKKCVIKRKIIFENYKNCLEATQLDNKIHYLQRNKIAKDILKNNHTEFIKNNEIIIKKQYRFKSETHNIFTEEINNFKITLSWNDDKIMN